VRSYDRTTTLGAQGGADVVDYEIRETYEGRRSPSGEQPSKRIGVVDQESIDTAIEDVRNAAVDRDRLALQQAGGIYAGLDKMRPKVQPTPLTEPKRARLRARLNPEAEDAIQRKTGSSD